MQELLALLDDLNLDLDAQEVADLLWLAHQQPHMVTIPVVEEARVLPIIAIADPGIDTAGGLRSIPNRPSRSATVTLPPVNPTTIANKTGSSLSFKAPTAPALRNTLEISRALRPLMRKVPSRTKQILDEEATAIAIAENVDRPWQPVLQAAPERWLDLALVVEDTRSTIIWQELIVEVQQLLERQGAFRTMRIWTLKVDMNGQLELFPRREDSSVAQKSRSLDTLMDATGRQLILFLSDCVSPIWRNGKIHQCLQAWATTSPVAIMQFFPERLWSRTALGLGDLVMLQAFAPGMLSSRLQVNDRSGWPLKSLPTTLVLPIITLEADVLGQWAKVMNGGGSNQTVGISFDLDFIATQSKVIPINKQRSLREPAELVQRFRVTASPLARRLAELMSLVPVSLPVVHLIQETLLPASRQVHVAEIFMSGLLEPQVVPEAKINAAIRYQFVAGVRELLQETVRKTEVLRVLDKVADYIADRAGLSMRGFAALLTLPSVRGGSVDAEVLAFAELSLEVLRRMGGEYAAWAEEVVASTAAAAIAASVSDAAIDWETVEFEAVTVEIVDEPNIGLEPFDFEIATLVQKKTRLLQRKTKWDIETKSGQAWQFMESLGKGIDLAMVNIPAGGFFMGAPKGELESRENEKPQHLVKVPEFYFGKYPVTQAQWKSIANLTPINKELNPDISRFKGDTLPVDSLDWNDAMEFCQRLSKLTGQAYRLPSEAEWEYACRAGTITPFHFGETISTEVANYDGDYVYGKGVKGVARNKTTPVGSFKVANAFGLYDMHGNVWEWCQDTWHSNYDGAPTDGSAWVDDNNNSHLLRGGSWNSSPQNCRSACRYFNVNPDYHDLDVGFRVVCEAARTP
jgi:formylglycine-generating enzyme required for sulfatase activity